MIKLQPFTRQDFETFKSWISNAEELFQFAGPIFTFPLTDDQLEDYINRTDLKPFKAVETTSNKAVGHCELNFINGNRRLSRILVGDKTMRGKKVGEQMVRQMVELLFENPETTSVDLNTFDWNKAAIRCYEKVGFRINPDFSEAMNVNGNEWTKINLSLKRMDYERASK